jgi:Zn-dependent alcohol dehydrogenase
VEGATVLIVGLGGVGVSAVQGARLAGASRIIGVDPVASRREQARGFGATDVVDPSADDVISVCRELTAGIGVDYAFDIAANASTMASCINALRSGGMLTVVGVPGFEDRIEVPVIAWALAEKTVTGSFIGSSNPHLEFPRLLSLWRAGRLDLTGMVTATRPLEEISSAFEDMKAGRGLRTVVDLQASS